MHRPPHRYVTVHRRIVTFEELHVIEYLERRIAWRLRELDLNQASASIAAGFKRSQLNEIIRMSPDLSEHHFEQLCEILRIDDPAYWYRPIPTHPELDPDYAAALWEQSGRDGLPGAYGDADRIIEVGAREASEQSFLITDPWGHTVGAVRKPLSEREIERTRRKQAMARVKHGQAPKGLKRPHFQITLTNSETETFLECRAKWGFAYVERLRPKETPVYFREGHVLHAGIRAWYEGTNLDIEEVGDIDEYAIERAVIDAGERVQAMTDAGVWTVEQADDEHDRLDDLVRRLLPVYFRTFRDDLARYEVIGCEIPFNVQVTNLSRGGRHLRHAGVFDLLLYDSMSNELILADHKSTAYTLDAIEKRLDFDPQIGGYLYALGRMLSERRLRRPSGEPVPGDARLGTVFYNVIRRKAPNTPSINKDGSVSAAQIDTLPEIYAAALDGQARRIDKPPTDKQLAILEGLRAHGDAAWVRRFEHYRNAASVRRWYAEQRELSKHVRAAIKYPIQRYRSPGACTKPNSPTCLYRAVCENPESQTIREELYRIATDKHEEVAEAAEREGA